MFDFFKKKSQIEVLQEKYAKLLKEAHQLSTINRTESDARAAEAEEVAKMIDNLKEPQS